MRSNRACSVRAQTNPKGITLRSTQNRAPPVCSRWGTNVEGRLGACNLDPVRVTETTAHQPELQPAFAGTCGLSGGAMTRICRQLRLSTGAEWISAGVGGLSTPRHTNRFPAWSSGQSALRGNSATACREGQYL